MSIFNIYKISFFSFYYKYYDNNQYLVNIEFENKFKNIKIDW